MNYKKVSKSLQDLPLAKTHCLRLSLHKRGTHNSEAKEEYTDIPFNSVTSLSLSQRHEIMFLAKHMEGGPPIPKFLGGSTKARKRNSILI